MNQKIINLIYWGMIVLVVVTCVIVIVYLTSSAKGCLADPLKYYIQKTGETCFCNKGFP